MEGWPPGSEGFPAETCGNCYFCGEHGARNLVKFYPDGLDFEWSLLEEPNEEAVPCDDSSDYETYDEEFLQHTNSLPSRERFRHITKNLKKTLPKSNKRKVAKDSYKVTRKVIKKTQRKILHEKRKESVKISAQIQTFEDEDKEQDCLFGQLTQMPEYSYVKEGKRTMEQLRSYRDHLQEEYFSGNENVQQDYNPYSTDYEQDHRTCPLADVYEHMYQQSLLKQNEKKHFSFWFNDNGFETLQELCDYHSKYQEEQALQYE